MNIEEKYRVVEAGDPEDVTDEVNKLMGQGWKPLGGIAVVQTFIGEPDFYQAMVKA